MKECPICRAKCFEDMEVCYGCLHEFNGESMRADLAAGLPAPAQESDQDLFEDDPLFEETFPFASLGGCMLGAQESAPADMVSTGALVHVDGPAFRLEIPASMKSFTVRCEGIQIDGCLA